MAKIPEQDIKSFFTSPLATTAAQGLKAEACVHLTIEGESYFFVRKAKKNQLLRRAPVTPQIEFTIPADSMRYFIDLEALPGSSLSVLGLAILQALLADDPKRKVLFRAKASWLTLFALGYFSVLKAGGPEVASYMAKKGFGGMLQLRSLLQKFRG
jgi:hypothetical protein